ncbi:MAG: hypothetical protein Q4C43_06420 [Prevotella sp.]|nr:hypothetical protein [Prevotella sp.]
MLKFISSPQTIIFVFAVYLSFFMHDGINVLLPVMAIFSGINILRTKVRIEELFCWAMILFLLLSAVGNVLTKWSSVIYTLIFLIIFINYLRGILGKKLSAIKYLEILRILVILFFITLLIQQVCVLAGLPVFNMILDYSERNMWKLSSLADEPSHTARILALIMFSYIQVYKYVYNRKYDVLKLLKNDRKERWLWIGFLWTILTIQSSTAILFVAILAFVLSGQKKATAIGIIVVMVLGFYLFRENELMKRNIEVTAATFTLNEQQICAADNSAAHRIVPIIIISKHLSLFDLEGFLGHGAGAAKEIVLGLFPGYTTETIIDGGAILQIWYDSGILLFASYLFLTLKYCTDKRNKMSYLFWVLLIVINSINTQITWLSIMLLFANKHFSKIQKISYENFPHNTWESKS